MYNMVFFIDNTSNAQMCDHYHINPHLCCSNVGLNLKFIIFGQNQKIIFVSTKQTPK